MRNRVGPRGGLYVLRDSNMLSPPRTEPQVIQQVVKSLRPLSHPDHPLEVGVRKIIDFRNYGSAKKSKSYRYDLRSSGLYCIVLYCIVLYCIVVGSRRLMPPDTLQPKVYCTNPGLSSFLPAPPGVSTRDPSSKRRNYLGEKWPMNFA